MTPRTTTDIAARPTRATSLECALAPPYPLMFPIGANDTTLCEMSIRSSTSTTAARSL